MLSQAMMGDVAANIEKAADVLGAGAPQPVKALLDYEWTCLNLNSISENSELSPLARFISENTDFADMRLEQVTSELKALQNLSSDENIKQYDAAIEQIQNITAPVIFWMKENGIEPTLNNIIATNALIKNPRFISDSLNDLTDEVSDEISLDIASVLNDDFPDALTGLHNKLEAIKISNFTGENIKRLGLIQNAIKVLNYVERREDNSYYQIPVKLHDKIASLNMYILNENIQSKADKKIFMSLDMGSLGNVSVYLNTDGNSLKLIINADTDEASEYLKSHAQELSELVNAAGGVLTDVKFGVEAEKNILEKEVSPIQNPNAKEKSVLSEFEFLV